ncbi:2OG-Fe(II)oxygenase superfamily protein [Echria macrotheca]|uniref:2OG-Fe(II)oxygenase superfamily protein n=1 Tax=Echria macrotheca TaxID=438768 RepID=A0AAJ0F3Z6_9PEZI|nr:2OG-Fe(II)oxygenase superfamily protein [Echria macrotheca]
MVSLSWALVLAGVGVAASECTHPSFKAYKLSSSPLIIYLQNFLTKNERSHLKEISKPRFRRSVVASDEGAKQSRIRTSQSTDLPRDEIVKCIEQRAMEFQGFDTKESQLEPLQLVKYGPGEHYDYHTDWLADPQYTTSFNGGNRMTSFLVYVYVSNDTTGGGTGFPLVDAPRDERWCGFVECDEPFGSGVVFRPVEGNAIFWENLIPGTGRGDGRTEHAGLPVTSGEKIGMNIWTRQAGISDEVRKEGGPLDF